MNEEETSFMLEQYKQCQDNWRQLWVTFWQVPTLAVTIASGVFFVVFKEFWADDKWFQSGIILGVGSLLTLTIAYVCHKHRFFADVWTCTLTAMEKQAPFLKRVQRSTFFEKEFNGQKDSFWFWKEAKRHQAASGQKLFIVMLFVVGCLQVFLAGFSFWRAFTLPIFLFPIAALVVAFGFMAWRSDFFRKIPPEV